MRKLVRGNGYDCCCLFNKIKGKGGIQMEKKENLRLVQNFVVVAFAALLMLFGAGNAVADEGWSIKLEPMLMDVKGNDVHVGDVFKYRSSEFITNEDGNYTFNYGITYEPINLDMDEKLTLRTEITYRKNQWGFGLSGWWLNTDASVNGRVTTPPENGVNGVRMWDHSIRPVYNELQGSNLSPVDYWAENDLDTYTMDLFGIRRLAENTDSHIDLTFGLKLGSIDNERKEGQSQRAYIDDYQYPDVVYDNHITMESKSKADYDVMAGPVIGFQGEAKYKRFSLEGLLNQSILIGKVKKSGTWTDIDDIVYKYTPTGATRHYTYTGKFAFSQEKTEAIPVTEAKLKFSVDVARNLTIGVGTFASIWWDAPLAPKWSMPGDWTAGEGTGWRLQKENLIYYGSMVSLNISF